MSPRATNRERGLWPMVMPVPGGADRAIPGVAFVITGPGLTNVLTAMAQARADSSPMLVISSVNPRASLGRGLG